LNIYSIINKKNARRSAKMAQAMLRKARTKLDLARMLNKVIQPAVAGPLLFKKIKTP
jgi:hypothetical protein